MFADLRLYDSTLILLSTHILSKHKICMNRHHWHVQQPDIVQPYYLLGVNLQSVTPDQVASKICASPEVTKLLNDNNCNIFWANISASTDKQNPSKNRSVQIYAIETMRDQCKHLINNIDKFNNTINTSIFIPNSLCYTNTKAWNKVVAAHKAFLAHTQAKSKSFCRFNNITFNSVSGDFCLVPQQ